MVKEEFFYATSLFPVSDSESNKFWLEIEKAYAHSKRWYHNLTHLENLLAELTPHRLAFADWSVVIFALVYHDIVYNVLKSDNEEKSAALAVKRLSEMKVPDSKINHCREIILATKHHQPVGLEIDLFTDADLAILGASHENYRQYYGQIREEYSIYPDLVYNPGRKKVLNHFLGMKRIFKTDEFFSKYEQNARRNLMAELQQLA